jgi:phosphatidylglycerol lysyltransferase
MSATAENALSPEARRARALVLRLGWNATVYQIVNRGIAHWFPREENAVVGYVRKARVRVVAGAPVCDENRLPEVVKEWEGYCRARGDKVCYFGAAGRIKTLLGSNPEYSTVALGAQPIWNPVGWDDIIKTNRSLRAQLSRARNKGVEVQEWPASRATRNPELKRVLDQWLRTRGLPTLHFLVEPDTLSFLEDRRVFVASQNGKAIGFTVLCPIPARNGWLTEQFPRGRAAPNGTVELLMDTAIRTVADEGAHYVTMGLVPLSENGRMPEEENPAWLKLMLAWTRAHGRRFYNFGGLEAFKAKFRPDAWEAIYAISNERSFSPRSLYAIAAAFTGTSPFFALARGARKALRQEGQWLGAKKSGITR